MNRRKSVKWEITESLLQRKEDGKYKWTIRQIAEKRGVSPQNIYEMMNIRKFKRDEDTKTENRSNEKNR